uniref:Uncharacterized protein n=1 Tax=viral metagenome TaxID=1070528 RepID=A0A6C0JW82_9ZZZZ
MDTQTTKDNVSIEKLDTFKKIIREMVNDLLVTFPELNQTLHVDLKLLCQTPDDDTSNEAANRVRTYCMGVLPERFINIIYMNETMFENMDNDLNFLPGINYRILWKENLTETTRKNIWRYLQLLLFSLISDITDKSMFGDTSNLFTDNDDVEQFKEKLEETMYDMKEMFEGMEDTPNPDLSAENVFEHMNEMMNGKLGKIAKELAEETVSNLNVDVNDAKGVTEVMSKMLSNPSAMMDMIKNVGTKIDDKIKTGDIKESELLEEALSMMQKMKDIPGMKDIQDKLNKMGLSSNKVNNSAMKTQMERNIKKAKYKEYLRTRANTKVQTPSEMSVDELSQATKKSDEICAELLKEPENKVFTCGPKAERSTNKKKGKGKGKNK